MATFFEAMSGQDSMAEPCGEEIYFRIDSVKKREEKGGDSQPTSKECPHDLLTSHKALPLNGSAISPVVCKHDTIADLFYLRKLILFPRIWSVRLKIPWEESVFWPGCLINTSKSNWSLVLLKPSAYKFDGFLPDCSTHH